MAISLSYPDQTYSQANKPSNETLKGDLQLIEDGVNASITATSTDTLTNKTLTSPIINTPTITSPTIKTWDGWNMVTDSWSYASADAPTFTITVPSGAASLYSVGMKIKLTQTTVKYFIITAVADTVLTVYGGTDYTLTNATISSIYVSMMKAPLGFPVDPIKWTVAVSNTGNQSSAASAGTWYNMGTTNSQISVPIGSWNVFYQTVLMIDRTTALAENEVWTALSTANNSQSDMELGTYSKYTATSGVDTYYVTFNAGKQLLVASKTLYYLIAKTGNAGDLAFRGDLQNTVIRAVCAYL